jgi:4-amino-4-deoxy-L-arabinose transferase-like glycosyltransferase
MKRYVLIALIVLFAGCIRFWQLPTVPPSLNSDEVAIGYNAYSLLRTGRDEYNKPFPLTFRSFDDYKMPVYVYMVAGSMGLFGFSDFAVRFPSALLGTLSVLCVYFLVLELFRSEAQNPKYKIQNNDKTQNSNALDLGFRNLDLQKIALVSAFLFAVSPWSVMFSRSGYEANVAVFFNIAAVYTLFMGLRRSPYLPLSAILFSLSIWTYHTCRIFVPLLLLGFIFIYRKELLKRKIAVCVSILIGFALLFPIMKMTFSPEGRMRAMGVSAYANPDSIKQSIAWTIQDQANGQAIFSIFHNRRLEYVRTFLRGYFAHFDLNFLFLDKSIERYRAPGVGLLYLFELPLLCIGAYQLIRKRVKGSIVIFWWLLAAPVAAAFTLQLPHPVRTLVFLPAFQIIAAVGLVELIKVFEEKKKNIVYCLLFIVLCMSVVGNIVYFFHQYFIHLPVDNAQYWYTGRKEMIAKLKLIESQYDRIIISNKLDFPYIFFLYYWPVEPQEYQEAGGTLSGGFLEEGNKYGKYEFRSINILQQSAFKKVLFVGLPGEEFKEKFVVDRIYYPNGLPAIVFFR